MKTKLVPLVAGLLLVSASTVMSQSWDLVGNAGTDPANDFVGTTDNKNFKIRTNNVVRMNITSTGKVAIGTHSPIFKLDVKGGSITTDSMYRIKGVQVLIRDNGNNVQVGDATAKVGIGTALPATELEVVGVITATGGNSGNWNTAFGWGDHAAAGYLTAETDPEVGANVTNFVPKWNGSALVTSNIFSNGTFTGINTSSGIGAAQLVIGNANAGFGGMYLNSTGTAGTRKPFYGYALDNVANAWTYLDEATGSWRVYNGGLDRLTVESSGQVGIGTNAPNYYLDIQAGLALRALNAVSSVVGSSGQIVNFERTSAPLAANDILQITVPAGSPDNFQFIEADRGGINSFAVNGNGAVGIGGSAHTTAGLLVQVGSDVSPTAGGHIISGDPVGVNIGIDDNEIMARNNGVVSPLFLQNSGGDLVLCAASGNVMIGISTPATGYILSVDGKVMAEEVRVELSGNWPDYVFDKNYILKSIDDLEQFIETNKHLPGMPSADEIKTDGHHIGEIQMKLVEKTEENTLYIIELKKEIDLLKAKIELLEKK